MLQLNWSLDERFRQNCLHRPQYSFRTLLVCGIDLFWYLVNGENRFHDNLLFFHTSRSCQHVERAVYRFRWVHTEERQLQGWSININGVKFTLMNGSGGNHWRCIHGCFWNPRRERHQAHYAHSQCGFGDASGNNLARNTGISNDIDYVI